VGLG